MSQYGAYGYAKHGFSYAEILRRYYSETTLAQVSPAPVVRVLLRTGSSAATFTNAARAGGRALQPGKTYSVTKAGAGKLTLRSPTGRKLASFTGLLSVSPPPAASRSCSRASPATACATGAGAARSS